MKELSDLIKEIEQNVNEMEDCEDFIKLQSIFNHCNQYIRQFHKIIFHGGNEPYIIEIVSRLLKYLKTRRYINDSNLPEKLYEKDIRKITFYLVLNTDVSLKRDLSEDPEISHVLKTFPQMTKCLLMNCIWGLNLDEYFYEMISYTPLWFSLQYMDQALTSLTFAKPYEILDRIDKLINSLYFSICRTDQDYQKEERDMLVEQRILHTKTYDCIMSLLRHFHTPESSKFERWSEARLDKYSGFALKHLFNITLNSFDLFLNKKEILIEEKYRIYRLFAENPVKSEVYSENTEDVLKRVINSLLNTLQTLVMDVTCHTFISWVEVDMDDDEIDPLTLQRIVGESAFKLGEILSSNDCFDHNVVNQLKSISLKPQTVEEKAGKLNLGELMVRIEKIEDQNDRLAYFNEFLGRGEIVLGNIECLNMIKDNVPLISVDHLKIIINHHNQSVIVDEDQEEDLTIKEIVLKSINNLKIDELTSLIVYMIENYGQQFDRYQEENLNEQIIEFTNKIICDLHRDVAEMRLIFQNPTLFFSRLTQSLYDRGVCSETFIEAIVKIITKTESISYNFINDQVEKMLKEDFEITKSSALPTFILRLYEVGFYDKNAFLDVDLLTAAITSFEVKNLKAFYEIVMMIESILKSNKGNIPCNILGKIVFVMCEMSEKLRYDVTKLEEIAEIDRMEVLEAILRLIQLIVHDLKMSKTEIEAKIADYKRITKYYFQKKDFAPFLYDGILEASSKKQDIRLFLSKTFVQCTSQEAQKLATDSLLAPNISDAVLIITVLLAEQEHHFECLKNCLSNYLIVLDNKILPNKTTDEDRAKLVKSIRTIISKLPAATKDDILYTMSHGLLTIVTLIKAENPSVDVTDIEGMVI